MTTKKTENKNPPIEASRITPKIMGASAGLSMWMIIPISRAKKNSIPIISLRIKKVRDHLLSVTTPQSWSSGQTSGLF